MCKAIEDITAERQRQIEVEGWTLDHDDRIGAGALSAAAACYALGSERTGRYTPFRGEYHWTCAWPWAHQWWKPSDRRRNLIKAGALIVAEIERLDRAQP